MGTSVNYADRVDYHRRSLIGQWSRDIIMTSVSNPEVLSICYSQGWCSSANYMTKQEAEAVTSLGSAFKQSTIKSFDEFKFFTGITTLDSQAFYYARSLASITIPSSITTGGSGALSRCESLKTVTWNSSTLTNANVTGCSYVTEFKTDNPALAVVDGCLYSADKTILYAVPPKKTSYTWLGTETTIGEQSFRSSSINTAMVFPSTVTTIEATPFYDYLALTSLDLSATAVTTLSAVLRVSSSQTSCTQFILPSGLVSITGNLVNGVGGLTSITIPSTVTSITNGTQWMKNFQYITFAGETPPTISGGVLTTGTVEAIYVPASSVDTYKSLSFFANVTNLIQAIPTNS